MQGLLASMSAFVVFCAVLDLTLIPWGIGGSFTAAISANILILFLALLRIKRDAA